MTLRRTVVGPCLVVDRLEDRVNPGGGTFDATTGTFNFSVAIQYNATESELASIQTAFQIGSDIIRDATDGQHRFGNVTIVNDSGESAEAEFYVWKQPASKPGRPDAQAAGYGTRGLHVNLYQNGSTLYGGTSLDSNKANGAGYTVAHEFGHQAYGILDEYSGPQIGSNGLPVLGADGKWATITTQNAKTNSATLNFSLMDDFFRLGGRGTPFTLNEFSVASNHDPDNDTFQSYVNGRNDWAQVATRYPIFIPRGLPQDTISPASVPVNFRHSTTNAPFTVLVLENSDTVTVNDLRGFIQIGSSLYLQTARADESVGVFHYASGVNITSPIRPMTDANRQSAIAAIGALSADTDPIVEPYRALELASGQIESRADSPNRVIVLVGSGVQTATRNVIDLIPDLNRNNISVIAVLANPHPTSADQAAFQTLATQTGGAFISINEMGDFAEVVSTFGTFRQGNGLLTQAPPSDLIANGTLTQTVEVQPGTPEVLLGSAGLTPEAAYTVSLRSPSGQEITAAGPGVTPLAPGPIVGFRVSNPEPGTWTVVSTAGSSDVGRVGVVGLQPNDPYRVVVSADVGQVVFPSPVTVHVTPMFQGKSVVGATVSGLAISPTGVRTPLVFFDDGLPAHGDVMSGDGIYSTKFQGYTDNSTGTYTFTAVVNGSGATTAAGEGIPGDGLGDQAPESVPDFTRTGSGTAVVTGVPATVVSNDLSTLITPAGPTSFNVTVQNNGSTTATTTRGRVFLGSALRVASGTASQGTFAAGDDGSVTFDVGALDPGATATLTLTVVPQRSGIVNVIANVASGDQIDPLPENDSVVLPIPLTRPELVGVGGDRGNGTLVVVNPVTQDQRTLTPFGAAFTGGVRVATGDLTGDGVPDVVAGAGPGGRPEVVIFDGATGAEIRRTLGFEEAFTGGVYVAVGDFNGDGLVDVVITPDEGGGPRVRVFDGPSGTQLADFFGIEDKDFRGGARATTGDVNGDGVPDLLVGAGFGGGPRLAVFDGSKLTPTGAPKLFGDILVFENTLRNGVFVAAGDLTGDGEADVIVGGGPGGGPRVFGLNGADLIASGGKTQTPVANFFAGDPNNRQGVRVAVKDLDGDALADLVAGSGATASVTTYAGKTISAEGVPPPLADVAPFSVAAFGVYVG